MTILQPVVSPGEVRLPLVTETLRVDKRVVETGRVRVRTVVDVADNWVRETLARDDVEITRVPIDREVAVAPADRVEGDTTIISIVEEVLVVERKLMLREEVHMRRVHATTPVEHVVAVRTMRAVIERDAPERGAGAPPTVADVDRIETASGGEDAPVASHATTGGEAENRRPPVAVLAR